MVLAINHLNHIRYRAIYSIADQMASRDPLMKARGYFALNYIQDAINQIEIVIADNRRSNSNNRLDAIYLLASELFKEENRTSIKLRESLEYCLTTVSQSHDCRYKTAELVYKHLNGKTYKKPEYFIQAISNICRPLEKGLLSGKSSKTTILRQIEKEIKAKVTYH